MSGSVSRGDAEIVALFGTSADPPTLGHRALLEGLTSHYPRVVTWASDNPFKQHGAPLAVRAALLQAVVEGLGNPRLSLDQSLSHSRAIESLSLAHRKWPAANLVFVVGSDLVGQIPRWAKAEQILKRCRLAVVPRQGWPLGPELLVPLRLLGAKLDVLELEVPATASSKIRQHPDPELVPAELWPTLLEHNLYGLEAALPSGQPAPPSPR